jgi:DNA-binding IclR family transcriptional regulator
VLTSIKKGTALIEAFVGSQREWSILELCQVTGMPQPTIHHFLASFKAAGWVTQDSRTKRYRLGAKLWEIGCAAVDFSRIAESSRPLLHRFVEECGETVHLGMIAPENPLTVIYIDRVDSSEPVRIVTELGSKAPSYSSAMGKTIISHNPQFESVVLQSPLTPVTEQTIIDPEQLADDFKATRHRGYSIARGEFMGEMVGIAAPIRDRFDVVTLGIGIWSPAMRMSDGYIETISIKLMATARDISRQLGHIA